MATANDSFLLLISSVGKLSESFDKAWDTNSRKTVTKYVPLVRDVYAIFLTNDPVRINEGVIPFLVTFLSDLSSMVCAESQRDSRDQSVKHAQHLIKQLPGVVGSLKKNQLDAAKNATETSSFSNLLASASVRDEIYQLRSDFASFSKEVREALSIISNDLKLIKRSKLISE